MQWIHLILLKVKLYSKNKNVIVINNNYIFIVPGVVELIE